ncbi:hypothetical protein J6590_065267 [Homalodisca vitripennis]|nr:hypothetical protein J6590_065267 [Homalodisca vitripennis]
MTFTGPHIFVADLRRQFTSVLPDIPYCLHGPSTSSSRVRFNGVINRGGEKEWGWRGPSCQLQIARVRSSSHGVIWAWTLQARVNFFSKRASSAKRCAAGKHRRVTKTIARHFNNFTNYSFPCPCGFVCLRLAVNRSRPIGHVTLSANRKLSCLSRDYCQLIKTTMSLSGIFGIYRYCSALSPLFLSASVDHPIKSNTCYYVYMGKDAMSRRKSNKTAVACMTGTDVCMYVCTDVTVSMARAAYIFTDCDNNSASHRQYKNNLKLTTSTTTTKG